jgi:hypothetical protein
LVSSRIGRRGRDGRVRRRVRARARAGPRALSVELWRLSDADRHGWAELAARTGWTEVERFDVPGAFAWRHRLPGSWELTWQQTYDVGNLRDVRIMPASGELPPPHHGR